MDKSLTKTQADNKNSLTSKIFVMQMNIKHSNENQL